MVEQQNGADAPAQPFFQVSKKHKLYYDAIILLTTKIISTYTRFTFVLLEFKPRFTSYLHFYGSPNCGSSRDIHSFCFVYFRLFVDIVEERDAFIFFVKLSQLSSCYRSNKLHRLLQYRFFCNKNKYLEEKKFYICLILTFIWPCPLIGSPQIGYKAS